MRSEDEIKKELEETKLKLENLEYEKINYNGDSGAERYMFLTSSRQIIDGLYRTINQLEEELIKNTTQAQPH